MFFEVLSPIYHSPITIESLTYRVLLGTLANAASAPRIVDGWRTCRSGQTDTVYGGLLNRCVLSREPRRRMRLCSAVARSR
jgi:hypothetical protein